MEDKVSHVLRLVGVIPGLRLIVSLMVLVVGFVLRWKTAVQYSNGFFIAGALVILFGTLSVAGGFQQRASFPVVYVETASQASLAEGGQRMMADINQRYGTLVLMVRTGCLLMSISVAISELF